MKLLASLIGRVWNTNKKTKVLGWKVLHCITVQEWRVRTFTFLANEENRTSSPLVENLLTTFLVNSSAWEFSSGWQEKRVNKYKKARAEMTKKSRKTWKNVPTAVTVEHLSEVMLICYLSKVVSMPACLKCPVLSLSSQTIKSCRFQHDLVMIFIWNTLQHFVSPPPSKRTEKQ